LRTGGLPVILPFPLVDQYSPAESEIGDKPGGLNLPARNHNGLTSSAAAVVPGSRFSSMSNDPVWRIARW